MTFKIIKQCLCCNKENLKKILDLGRQPLANDYKETPSINENEIYPLELNLCENCWHAQLSVCVDRELIFKNYNYVSGTSKTLNKYFRWFAEGISKTLTKEAKVLEIAANDGSLVKELINYGISAIGIDPAENLVSIAQNKGIPVELGFWPESENNFEDIFDLIICMNVVAHVDKPIEFIKACRRKIKKDGLILIQPSQVRMFQNMEFDTCYHEHLSFFNTSSIRALAENSGLKLLGSFITKIHGDSPVYILGLTKSEAQITLLKSNFGVGEFAITEDLEEYENSIKLFNLETYQNFSSSASQTLNKLSEIINMHKNEGFDIAFVGAAAKALTVINAIKIEPNYFFDEALLKIGKYPPGMQLKITDLQSAKYLSKKTLFIITAWNFKNELIEKLASNGVPKGSKLFVYFPKPLLTDI